MWKWERVDLSVGSVESTIWLKKKTIESGSTIEYLWGFRTEKNTRGHVVIEAGSTIYDRQVSGVEIEFLTPNRLLIKPAGSALHTIRK